MATTLVTHNLIVRFMTEPQDCIGTYVNGSLCNIEEGSRAVFEWAEQLGCPLRFERTPETFPWTLEVEFWLNENVAPEGYCWTWHEGNFVFARLSDLE